MSSPIITGLMIFFSATTVGVALYPIVKLAPSWLHRAVNRKVDFHRAATVALATAIEQTPHDPAQRERLQAQHDFHRAAMASLAPDATVPESNRSIDAAA